MVTGSKEGLSTRRRPLLSIGMAVRNSEDFVIEAIQSVLNQTFEDWELILIDDGSTDDTAGRMRKYRDSRILHIQDGLCKGLSSRLNQCIDLASGIYFARMDGDDVCYPKRFQLQIQYLREHPDIDLLGGGTLVFCDAQNPLGKWIPPTNHDAICNRTFAGISMAHPSYVGKTSWFRFHHYCEKTVFAQDQDLLLRAWRTSRFANLQTIVLGYRLKWSLNKSFKTRYYFARILLSEFVLYGESLKGLLAVIRQVLMCGADIAAMATGQQSVLQRCRLQALSSLDVLEWQRLCHSIELKGIV